VIGVHSPKFIGERDTESVRQAILRLNVGHPVVNDRDFRVWKAYAARAWPTLMFLDPRGKVIGKHEGEFPLEPFDRLIGEMVAEFDAASLLDRQPLDLGAERPAGATPLLFPGKLMADEATDRLIISDTGHHRLMVADLNGQVQHVVGSGTEGFDDGPSEVATFSHPQGLALDGTTLYVADTENHAVRAVDLIAGTVVTVAGTGAQLMGPRVGGPARQTALSSPWDLALLDGTLYVAMAGAHQLWSMRPDSGFIVPHTGNGREDLIDGPLGEASMNQPSGLATDGTRLYVADSEASAIRVVEPGPDGTIRTIVGEGLFEFGDRDGRGPAEVRLQHPVGVAWHAGVVYVADTYNHKIKRLDPITAECRTWLGHGAPGHDDGDADAARFSEPSGLAAAGGRLYIADTNNHAVRIADLTTGVVTTLELSGLPQL
jgi:DNA-binding beta-propeller fold protein YncE